MRTTLTDILCSTGGEEGRLASPRILKYKLDKAKQNMKEIFVNLESMNCEGEQVKLP